MSISCHPLSYVLPNGRVLFNDLSFIIPSGHVGLVGPNGVGKSTLAQLLAGDLTPASGTIQSEALPHLFRQNEIRPQLTVGEYLIDIWLLVDPHSIAIRDQFLERLRLDATCESLSGGEWTRARLLKALTTLSNTLILDEPTNHLDADGRGVVMEFLRTTDRNLVIISHDRQLLEEVDVVIELTDQGMSVYGGSWSSYPQARAVERSALDQDIEFAKKEKHLADRRQQEKLEAQAKRQRNASAHQSHLGLPKIMAGNLKRQAQRTAAKLTLDSDRKSRIARENLDQLVQRQKSDPVIYAKFPLSSVPHSKLLFEAKDFNFRFQPNEPYLWHNPLNCSFSGPARIRLTGPNGSGKSTLIRLLLNEVIGDLQGSLRLGSLSVALLEQDFESVSEGTLSVLETFLQHIATNENTARGILAGFLFQREEVLTPISRLSGGEKIRLALAIAVSSETPPQLLILDEPTNHLDLQTIEFLEKTLRQFPGALLVVTHDEAFAENIGLTEELSLL